ncbi:hypothetical protein MSAN_01901300 [Mycena sanguinolenta]|uniref:Uncharacterized protein n=1 Tax=Mycena sanguinolenta TaxID=230812 RepID=A0A8H6XRP9_9AGAR|nr:hypothetical protein MSAN_01901300 [Mycena sanguinolenta]
MSAAVSASSPRLPPELECAVFQHIALLHPTSIPKLMLVATRVRDWVEPLLYRVVFLSFWDTNPKRRHGFPVLSPNMFLQKIAGKSPSFLQAAVKYLFVDSARPSVKIVTLNSVLAACPGVTHLFIHHQCPSPKILANLRFLCRLAIPIELMCDQNALQCTAPLFQNITHLRLRGHEQNIDIRRIWASLSDMPKLTHVGFDTPAIISLTPASMQENKRLQCIVHISWGDETVYDEDDADLFRPLADDLRFVCIELWTDYHLLWLRGAELAEGDDYWALAEAFIAAKLAGRVDRSCYSISEGDDF